MCACVCVCLFYFCVGCLGKLPQKVVLLRLQSSNAEFLPTKNCFPFLVPLLPPGLPLGATSEGGMPGWPYGFVVLFLLVASIALSFFSILLITHCILRLLRFQHFVYNLHTLFSAFIVPFNALGIPFLSSRSLRHFSITCSTSFSSLHIGQNGKSPYLKIWRFFLHRDRNCVMWKLISSHLE